MYKSKILEECMTAKTYPQWCFVFFFLTSRKHTPHVSSSQGCLLTRDLTVFYCINC